MVIFGLRESNIPYHSAASLSPHYMLTFVFGHRSTRLLLAYRIVADKCVIDVFALGFNRNTLYKLVPQLKSS